MDSRAPTSPAPLEEDVLTVPEVAGYLRVTPKTVYRLVKRGELHGFYVGRVLRLRRADVEKYIARPVDPRAVGELLCSEEDEDETPT